MLGLVALVVCARRHTLSPCPRSCFVVARRCHCVVAVAGERPFVFVSGRSSLFGWLWVVVGTARRVVVGVGLGLVNGRRGGGIYDDDER